MKPILLGFSGPVLTKEERDFFAEVNPFGFILFQRNCENPAQLFALTSSLREAVGRPDVPIFIDQEGGRVARLKPPFWRALPAMRILGALYEKDPIAGAEAMTLHSCITAQTLYEAGINGNCTPVLDLSYPDTSDVMGDRTFSASASVVAELGALAIENYLANGVYPVIKHLPGHGRVTSDPHHALPYVEASRAELESQDFQPFMALRNAPIGMNCHVVFKALDSDLPVSLSRKAHEEVIRDLIGFEGLLFSDDLAMKALSGPLDQIAAKALYAGADVILYCPGLLPEMRTICAGLPDMAAASLLRWERAQSLCRQPSKKLDVEAMAARLETLLQG